MTRARRQFPRNLARAFLVGLLACGSAFGQSDPAVRNVRRIAGEIHRLAPARQVGLDGNDAVDRLVAERFAQAVRQANDPDRQARAEKLLAEARRTRQELDTARQSREVSIQSGGVSRSHPLVRFSLENPWPGTVALGLLTLLMLSAGLYQKRQSVLLVGAGVAGLAVVLPLLASAIQTPTERKQLQRQGSSEEALDEAVQAASRNVLNRLAEASDALAGLWQHGRVTYPATVFVPGDGTLRLGDVRCKVYQIAPNFREPGNLPESGLEAPCVYLGPARQEDLAGRDLRGTIVLMDFDTDDRWLDAVQLGAKAVVFLETPQGVSNTQARRKITWTPLSVPRFYLRRSDLQEAMGEDFATRLDRPVRAELRQDQPGRWQRRELATDWLLIPGREPVTGEPFELNTSRQIIHLQAAKDSASVVPSLSPGASSAVNLALLLHLAEHFGKHPPRRPVLLSAVNHHCGAMQGENEFAWAAHATWANIRLELQWTRRERARMAFYQRHYQSLPEEQVLQTWRSASAEVAGQVLQIKTPIDDLLRQRLSRARQDLQNITYRLRRTGQAGPAETLRSRQEQCNQTIEQSLRLQQLFNRYGAKLRLADLDDADRRLLEELFAGLHRRFTLQKQELDADLARLEANLELRSRLLWISRPGLEPDDIDDLSGEQCQSLSWTPLTPLATLSLELSFGNDCAGLFFAGALGILEKRIERYGPQRIHNLARRIELLAERLDLAPPLVSTLFNRGGVSWQEHLGGDYFVGASASAIYGKPALSLLAVRDRRSLVWTPHDRPENLSDANVQRLAGMAARLVPALVDEPGLGTTWNAVGSTESLSARVQLRYEDRYATGTPQMPVSGALASVHQPALLWGVLGEVRTFALEKTSHRGEATFRSALWRNAAFLASRYDEPHRRLTHAMNMAPGGAKERSARLGIGGRSAFGTRLGVLFECRKRDLLGLSHPLSLVPVKSMDVIDVDRNATPHSFAVGGVMPASALASLHVPMAKNGTASVMLPEGRRFKLRFADGVATGSTEANPVEGEGFGVRTGDLLDLVPAAARDMWRLARSRLGLLSSKGVVNDVAESYTASAGQHIDRAEQLRQAGKTAAELNHAEIARGLGFRGYSMSRQTIADLIQAVVFFLALVVPFCFFFMKLLTPYTDIHRQLALFGAIFAVMSAMLYLVHPAFRVAQTPMVVVLAFVILGLAVFVAGVVLSRFNASMQQAIEEVQQSESTDAPRGRLAGVAFLVGVNNMKRRRIRTTLTCVTIVLVTFTMLSVISVKPNVEPVRLRLQADPPYAGLVYTTPDRGPIARLQADRLRAHFAGRARLVARAWAEQKGEYGQYQPYRWQPLEALPDAPSEALLSTVLLGLEPGENGQIAPLPLRAGRWFSSSRAPEVVLSEQAAGLLGLDRTNFAGQRLRMLGKVYELVGLVDDEALTAMRGLGENPLLPLLSEATQASAGQDNSDLGGGEDLLSQPGTRLAKPVNVALLPFGQVMDIPGGSCRLLSVKFTGPEASAQAWQAANELIRFQDLRLAVGLTDAVQPDEASTGIPAGQYMLAASSTAEVGGVLKIAIPIVIIATIIFNTMLGSVLERKREVGIYNAIGLNPGHVMMFFLAESFVYGLVGSVAGYLIGQGLSLALAGTLGLNLNYSSLSVVFVIFLSIGTVLASTIYPAVMAARAAVPSGQRRWNIPQPIGDEITLQFPFSYDAGRVLGVCCYLHEYMQQHVEASTGSFLAGLGPVGRVPGPGPDDPGGLAMVYDVAPAPFDLGVNQTLEFYASYHPDVKAHMISLHIRRISGQRSNWTAVNQPFLEALRKRLLGWRSQSARNQQDYCSRGEELFAHAPPLPTREGDA